MLLQRILLNASLLLLLAPPLAAQPGEPNDPRPEKRSGARGTAEPMLVFDQPNVTFADSYQYGEIRHVFPFRNAGSRPVVIERGIAVSGTGRVEAVPTLVPPGGTGEATVVQPLGDHLGQSNFRYALVTDEPGVARYRFSLSGFVESAYDPEKSELAFGTVDRAQGKSVEIEISSREVPRLEVLGFESLPPWLELKEAGRAGEDQQGVRLAARLVGKPPLGWQHGTIGVRTRVPNQPLHPIRYSAVIFDDLVPSVQPLSFGAVELGAAYQQKLELRSRRGLPLEIASAGDPEQRVAARLAPCPAAPEDRGCRQLELELRLGPLAPPGPFSGRIEIRQGPDGEILPLTYSGIAAAPGTPIRQLEVPAGAGGAPKPPGAER